MTLDEAIDIFKEIANNARNDIIDNDNLEPQEIHYNAQLELYAKEKEQIAEWLEELKQYKAIGTPEECRAAVEKQKELKSTDTYGFVAIGKTVEQFEQEIRNKAIDDFAESCKQDIMCQTFGLKPRNIDEIAEQLKAGDGE